MLRILTAVPFILATTGAIAGENIQENHMNLATPDVAAIATIVESVGAFADRGEFDALSRLYADEFTLDYASLNGQNASQKAPLALMSEWAAVLPGFDRTRHALSEIDVDVSDSLATARANVSAAHWLGDMYWQVDGHYDYRFAETDGQWKITSMTFTLEEETGTRDIFGPAIKAAASKTMPGHNLAIAERNKETVRRFFRTLESEDIPAFVNLFAEDGEQINPYNAGLFPKGAKGREELLAYWTPVPGNFDGMKFTIEEVLATEDANIVFAKYQGEIKLKDSDAVYSNNYYSTFKFDREGRITEYVEIFDPVVAARGFGLLDKLN